MTEDIEGENGVDYCISGNDPMERVRIANKREPISLSRWCAVKPCHANTRGEGRLLKPLVEEKEEAQIGVEVESLVGNIPLSEDIPFLGSS